MSIHQEVAQALREAGKWLDEHDWITGELFEWEDSLTRRDEEIIGACARGALLIAVGMRDRGKSLEAHEASRLTNIVTQAELAMIRLPWVESPRDEITLWNDRVAKSKETVIKAMYQAADEEEVKDG